MRKTQILEAKGILPPASRESGFMFLVSETTINRPGAFSIPPPLGNILQLFNPV